MVTVIAETILKVNPTLLGILVGAEGELPNRIFVYCGVKNEKSNHYYLFLDIYIFDFMLFFLFQIFIFYLLFAFFGGLGVAGFSDANVCCRQDSIKLRGSAMVIFQQQLGCSHWRIKCRNYLFYFYASIWH